MAHHYRPFGGSVGTIYSLKEGTTVEDVQSVLASSGWRFQANGWDTSYSDPSDSGHMLFVDISPRLDGNGKEIGEFITITESRASK